jgi:hypothetical protein
MEDKNLCSKTSDSIDPIGAEIIISILGLSVSIISAVYQFGLFSRQNKNLKIEFKKLKRMTLKLHNCLDDFLLIINRHGHYEDSNESSIVSENILLSATLMNLKEKDYYRWLDLKDSINKINKQAYLTIGKIREISEEIDEGSCAETMKKEIFLSFDKLLLNFGQLKLGTFVGELREAINHLDNLIADISK